MSLDKSYFNSIRLDTFRHRFYSVEAVDRLLVDIRAQADTMNRELEASARKLSAAQQTAETLTEENRDLLLKGQALSQEIISLREDLKAAEAVVVDKEALRAEIIGQANAEAEELLTEARKNAELCVATAQTEAEQRIASAKAEAEQCVTEASRKAEEMRSEAGQCLTSAKAEEERILSSAKEEAEQCIASAKEEAERILSEARADELMRKHSLCAAQLRVSVRRCSAGSVCSAKMLLLRWRRHFLRQGISIPNPLHVLILPGNSFYGLCRRRRATKRHRLIWQQRSTVLFRSWKILKASDFLRNLSIFPENNS